MAYTWKWKLEERGFKRVFTANYTEVQEKKWVYVEEYLNNSVVEANCGWAKVRYEVYENPLGGKEEYVILYPTKDDTGGRCINVSGNSLGATAQKVWNNIW